MCGPKDWNAGNHDTTIVVRCQKDLGFGLPGHLGWLKWEEMCMVRGIVLVSGCFGYIWIEQDLSRLALLFHVNSGTNMHFPAFHQANRDDSHILRVMRLHICQAVELMEAILSNKHIDYFTRRLEWSWIRPGFDMWDWCSHEWWWLCVPKSVWQRPANFCWGYRVTHSLIHLPK